MGKQSKPLQSKPITAEQKQAAGQARAKQCEAAVLKILDRYQCRPVFAQRTVDGQLIPLQGIPLVLLFVPNEVIDQNTPGGAPPPEGK